MPMKIPVSISACLAVGLTLAAGPALATPQEEQRVVELMIAWVKARESGNDKAAEAAGTEAHKLIAKLRPELGQAPPGTQAAVFAYVIDLADAHRPDAAPELRAAVGRLQIRSTRSMLSMIVQALDAYRMDRGTYPASGAKSLAQALANSTNPYVTALPSGAINAAGEWTDGWGTPLHYAHRADGKVILYSWGPNKRDDGGTGDDIAPAR